MESRLRNRLPAENYQVQFHPAPITLSPDHSILPPPRLHPLARLVVCALGVIFATFLIQFVMQAATTFVADAANRTPQQQFLDFLDQYALLVLVLPYPGVLLWLVICRSTLDRRSFPSLGLHWPGLIRQLIGGFLAGALAMSLLLGVLWLTGNIGFNGWSPYAFASNSWKTAAWLFAWLLAFFLVGFMEELLFRGYALHNLAAWLGTRGGIAIQAIVFALIHLSNVFATQAFLSDESTQSLPMSVLWGDAWRAMPNIALIGVFFALCYLKTGNLWFPIGFHAAWNFFLGCIYSLPVSGLNVFRLLEIEVSSDRWITGGAFGPEGSLLLTPLILALVYFAAKAPNHPQAEADLSLLHPQSTPIIEEPEQIDDSYLSGVHISMRSRETFDPAALEAMRQTNLLQPAPDKPIVSPAPEPEYSSAVEDPIPEPAVVEIQSTPEPVAAPEPNREPVEEIVAEPEKSELPVEPPKKAKPRW